MFQSSDDLSALAERVISKKEDLKRLNAPECRIAYLYSDKEKKNRGKTVYADTEKVSEKLKAIACVDFVVTFYRPSCSPLSEEKMEILMHHELKHVGFEPDGRCHIIPHDIEDFTDIVEDHGMNWIV